MKIRSFAARQVLDSRGNPTVEVEVNGQRAIVPSGASTGIHEALELRDGGPHYGGKGVLTAVHNAELLLKRASRKNFNSQAGFDTFIVSQDATHNKSRLGANALIACSTAFFRALAAEKGKPLFEFFRKPKRVPVPLSNVINGGAHAGNGLSIQEFMIIPSGLKTTQGQVRAVAEIYQVLKKDVGKKYGKTATSVGDEGGFAPPCKDTHDVLELISNAIHETGYSKQVSIGLDCAASQFYKDNHYFLDGRKHHASALLDHYARLQKEFKISYFEDPFYEEDFDTFAVFTRFMRGKALVVGDDLLVSKPSRVKVGIAKQACSAMILKPNQVGTITEALEAFVLARSAKWAVIASHRSGETEDPFIADFACAIEADFAKIGAPCRGERTAKYNELLRIAEKIK